ncbi:MAG: SUMF1/EgtB/PvdO family nonheme iron enzyme [Anaerolineae bacterium]|jgi:serine/threonine protein kinase|nr:SUMF1/EgtB/PvdO family nonheme iron enzyme [Anaerolineae bacterium]
MPNLIGKSLGRYHILEQIGEGGMAIVYKAFDTRLEREVAIKVVLPTRQQSSKFIKRFEREAKALAKLSHPNIVKVLDYGKEGDLPFIVMEYVPAGTLKKQLKGKTLNWKDALTLIKPIAEALGYAHQHGIVHRDVKPSNILIDKAKQPLLTDFGVAKMLEGDETLDLTNTGMGVGTPEYMAPEQFQGGNVDQRADIYSLGVVYYEMVTGRKPFQADTPAAIIWKQATETLPRPSTFVPDLPDKIEKFLLKALAKNPSNRFQNMSELVIALEHLLSRKNKDIFLKPSRATNKKKQGKKKLNKKRVIYAFLGMFILGIFYFMISYLDSSIKNAPSVINAEEVVLSTDAAVTKTVTVQPTLTPTKTLTPTPLPADIFDDKGVKMVLIPAGEFTMGSDYADDEKPIHQVFLDDYYIDVYEVTNAAYNACVEAGGCLSPQEKDSSARADYFENPEFADFPVIQVDWHMATSYCEWRGANLPTEAIWEKAARGSVSPPITYPWGETLDETFANFQQNIGDTSAVGSYEKGKSVYGVYDLAGNVWEWVSSLYQPYPYDTTDGREDLHATGPRVLRGGSWLNLEGNLRASVRLRAGATSTSSYIGFRCYRLP